MKMKVVNEKVLVKVANDEEVTEGGIILTSTKQERKYEGTVVGVGSHPDIAKCGVKEGVYVFYPKGLNTEVIVKENGLDVTYDIVSIYDILAVGTEE